MSLVISFPETTVFKLVLTLSSETIVYALPASTNAKIAPIPLTVFPASRHILSTLIRLARPLVPLDMYQFPLFALYVQTTASLVSPPQAPAHPALVLTSSATPVACSHVPTRISATTLSARLASTNVPPAPTPPIVFPASLPSRSTLIIPVSRPVPLVMCLSHLFALSAPITVLLVLPTPALALLAPVHTSFPDRFACKPAPILSLATALSVHLASISVTTAPAPLIAFLASVPFR